MKKGRHTNVSDLSWKSQSTTSTFGTSRYTSDEERRRRRRRRRNTKHTKDITTTRRLSLSLPSLASYVALYREVVLLQALALRLGVPMAGQVAPHTALAALCLAADNHFSSGQSESRMIEQKQNIQYKYNIIKYKVMQDKVVQTC
jgi:hypothetical protein